MHARDCATSLFLALWAFTGCGTPPLLPDPVLPPGSSIPAGIYSGNLSIELTLFEGDTTTTGSASNPLTLVIDNNGRLLDADGNPFAIGMLYYVDGGTIKLETTAQSIIAIGAQIVLRFALTARLDNGSATGTLTGTQTDTLSYDVDSNTLHFVRSQNYGGVDSRGTSITAMLKADAILDPG